MGIAASPPSQQALHHLHRNPNSARRAFAAEMPDPPAASMSRGFDQGVFTFSSGYVERAVYTADEQHVAQRCRRDKLGVQGLDDDPGDLPLVGIEGREEPLYGITTTTAGINNMLSDLFTFPSAGGPSATELLAHQIPAGNYRLQRPSAGFSGDWYAGCSRQGVPVDGGASLQQQQLSGLNAESAAAAMQLFLMNPPPPQQRQQAWRPPSPPHPSAPPPDLPLPESFQTPFLAGGDGAFGGRETGIDGGRGLSLSLSTSLQQLEMAKAEELRVRDEILYNGGRQQHQPPQMPGLTTAIRMTARGHGQQMPHAGYGGSSPSAVGGGAISPLRHSKYARAAQEVLAEVCSVVRGQMKGIRGKERMCPVVSSTSTNHNPASSSDGGGTATSAGPAAAAAGGAASPSSRDAPVPLSPADRSEHQRRKAKLLSMLDEVDQRYSLYCDQMQMVVDAFDAAMGFGTAAPYTALARMPMSRHFRCLKDAIAGQLRRACEQLGEKDGAGRASGITKGETPRLKLLEQRLWRQRAFTHGQMGTTTEQETWRPQRGLPERSVKILRAWLFEHFLHPYPSDADKHLLGRQAGLSRNQVSNWFINARVRLWKPMVEEMYQREAEEETGAGEIGDGGGRAQSPGRQQRRNAPPPGTGPVTKVDASQVPLSPPASGQQHCHYHHPFSSAPVLLPPAGPAGGAGSSETVALLGMDALPAAELCAPEGMAPDYGAALADPVLARAAFGVSGDVSLTLGLRHAGIMPDKVPFSARDLHGF